MDENAADEKRPACHEAMPWYRPVGSRDLLEPLALPSSWPVPPDQKNSRFACSDTSKEKHGRDAAVPKGPSIFCYTC